jgi:hypothetical protein
MKRAYKKTGGVESALKAEIEKAHALATKYIRDYRALQKEERRRSGTKKFETRLQMEAAYQGWLEQRARYAELYTVVTKAPSYG